MLIYVIAIALAGGFTLSPLAVSANPGEFTPENASMDSDSQHMTVVGVALAENIQDREPVGPVNPSISCEKEGQSQAAIPVVDSNANGRAFFWNTVQSSGDSTLQHIWLMKRDQSWEPMAKIDLKIGKSDAYRTWSSKKFDRNHHLGEWKIEVVTADHPDEVLCQSSFRVE